MYLIIYLTFFFPFFFLQGIFSEQVAVFGLSKIHCTFFSPTFFSCSRKKKSCSTPAGKNVKVTCVQSRRAGKQTVFRIAILPVDVRGGSGCLGNQLALNVEPLHGPAPCTNTPMALTSMHVKRRTWCLFASQLVCSVADRGASSWNIIALLYRRTWCDSPAAQQMACFLPPHWRTAPPHRR